MSERCWTDDEMAEWCGLSFDAGRNFEADRIADAMVELQVLWPDATPRTPEQVAEAYEQKVGQRMADMEAAFTRTFPDRAPYRGGPVDWETGRRHESV